jgi:hypothetical protein
VDQRQPPGQGSEGPIGPPRIRASGPIGPPRIRASAKRSNAANSVSCAAATTPDRLGFLLHRAPRAPRARAVSLSRRRRRPPRRDQRTRGAIDDRDDRESDPGGRLLPGNAEPAAQAPGVISTALATPAATSPTPPIATTARTPRRSRSSSPPSGSLRTRVLARTPTQLTLLRLGDLGRLTSHDSNVRAVMKLRLTAANVFPRAGNSHRPATRLPGRAGS